MTANLRKAQYDKLVSNLQTSIDTAKANAHPDEGKSEHQYHDRLSEESRIAEKCRFIGCRTFLDKLLKQYGDPRLKGFKTRAINYDDVVSLFEQSYREAIQEIRQTLPPTKDTEKAIKDFTLEACREAWLFGSLKTGEERSR